MFKSISYKQKSYLLIIAFVLMLYLSYALSISKTLEVLADIDLMEKQVENTNNLPQRISVIKKELNKIEHLLGINNDSSTTDILDKVSKYCNSQKILLKELPQPETYIENDINIKTYVFTFEGSFHKLLLLLEMLEKKYTAGRVVSANFYINKDIRTKQESLYLKLFIQKIKTSSNE